MTQSSSSSNKGDSLGAHGRGPGTAWEDPGRQTEEGDIWDKEKQELAKSKKKKVNKSFF